MDMFSISAIIGNTMTPEPMSEIIPKNPVVVPLLSVIENCGGSKAGKPFGILPVEQNIGTVVRARSLLVV